MFVWTSSPGSRRQQSLVFLWPSLRSRLHGRACRARRVRGSERENGSQNRHGVADERAAPPSRSDASGPPALRQPPRSRRAGSVRRGVRRRAGSGRERVYAVTHQQLTIDRLPKPPEKKKPLPHNDLRPIHPRRDPFFPHQPDTRAKTQPLAPKHLAPPIPTYFPGKAYPQKLPPPLRLGGKV